MFYGIGQMLSDMAYQGSQDEESRALWSTVHAAISVAALMQNARVAYTSGIRASYHLGNVLPSAFKASGSNRTAA